MNEEQNRKTRRTQARKVGRYILKNSQWYKDQQKRRAKKRRGK